MLSRGEYPLSGQTKPGYQWIVVAIIWFCHAVYFLSCMTVGTLAPFLQSELHLSSARIGMLSSAITIGSALSLIPSGMLADHLGSKWIMTGGLLLIAASAITVSTMHFYLAIFGLLIVLGAGVGANQTPGSKAIVMWFPTKGRATGMGIKQTGVTTGGILASFLLPAVALQCGSWKYSFVAAGLAALAAAVIVTLFYKDPARSDPQPGRQRVHYKHVFLQLLKNRDLMLTSFAGIFLMSIQSSLMTYFILYASSVWGFPSKKCGLFLALAFFSGSLARVGWSVASDYLFMGRRNIILILISILGMITTVWIDTTRNTSNVLLLYLLTCLLGIACFGWNAIHLTRAGELGGEFAGTSTGIVMVISNLGAIVGPPVFGYLIDRTGGYTMSWYFLIFCMVFVAFFTMLQKKESLHIRK